MLPLRGRGPLHAVSGGPHSLPVGRKISERRIRQMLQAGELEGEQTETGRWKIPQSVVHALLEQRRELLSDVP